MKLKLFSTCPHLDHNMHIELLNDSLVNINACCNQTVKKIIDYNYFYNNFVDIINTYNESDICGDDYYYTKHCMNDMTYGLNRCIGIKNKGELNYLDLSIFSQCNFKCMMCNRIRSNYENELKLLMRVVEQLKNIPYIKNLSISGNGEITVLSNEILDRIFNNIAQSNVDNIFIDTNAYNDISDILVKYNNRFNFQLLTSLHANNAKLFKDITTIDCFDIVVKNIKKYDMKYKQTIHIVCSKFNSDKLLDIVEFVKSLNLKNATICITPDKFNFIEMKSKIDKIKTYLKEKIDYIEFNKI